VRKIAFKNILLGILPPVVTLAALFVTSFDALQLLQLKTLDALFRLRGLRSVSDSPYQIVTIDDQTFRSLQRKWPFDGNLYARVIRNLNNAGARLIVFDIEFSEPNSRSPELDSTFAETIRQSGNVLLSGKIAYERTARLESPYAVIVPPQPRFLQSGAPWGLVNDITDPDNLSRRALLYLPYDGDFKPSLIAETLRLQQSLTSPASMEKRGDRVRIGDLNIPLYDANTFLINYYGPAGTFPSISFSSVLDDAAFDLAGRFDTDYMERIVSGQIKNPFHNKVVLIGASTPELHDLKHTPFDSSPEGGALMPGVEVYAHALQTCWDRAFIFRIPQTGVWGICFIVAWLTFFALGMLKPLKGAVFSLLIVPLSAGVSLWLFARYSIWFDPVAPAVTAVMAVPLASLYYYIGERREKLYIHRLFHRYLPDDLMRELMENPQILRLGGERRRLTILFGDIENFTSLAEEMIPEDMVKLLNEVMSVLTAVIRSERGMVDKYEGDLIMAEFGAPVFYPDHAERACRAALKMQEAFGELQSRGIIPSLRLRIGINTGNVIVGNMGSKELFDYTVLGDEVNLCARMERLNKVYRTKILITQATLDELPDGFVTRKLGDLQVQGKSKSVCVFELVATSLDDLDETTRNFIRIYRTAWRLIDRGEWTAAAKYFDDAAHLKPDDIPARMHRDRCRRLCDNVPIRQLEIPHVDEVL
jgi:adenylate cyclase